MKIMTILGTRPEIIRLSLIIKKLDQICDHVLVHTGQNYAESLNEIFFQDLSVRKPNYNLGIKARYPGEQIGAIIAGCERLMIEKRPDRILILGDTNSGLSALPAKRLGIPVYHMEAGNRCYDDRVPEEVNRRVIDHSSDILMPYTNRSKENLVREGIAQDKIYVIGNPIYEVIQAFDENIKGSEVFEKLKLNPKEYFLVTMHRAENVDNEARIKGLVESLNLIANIYKKPIVCSLHPRTKSKMEQYGISTSNQLIRWLVPLGFFDFVALERNALCVLSDSGTVQEECCIFQVPNITIRDVTERPETIECGSNVLSGSDPEKIISLVQMILQENSSWTPPEEYLRLNVANTVLRILMGFSMSILRN